MSKREPGSWSVVDGQYPSIKEVRGPSLKISCVMWASDLTEEDFVERDSDLALIASAPDLLAALQATISALERANCSTGYCCCGSPVDGHTMGDGHSPVDEGDYYQGKAIEAARAAIEKATGEKHE